MSRLANRRSRRVFDSVFGPGDISQPTPVATPAGGFPVQGQKWGGPDEKHRPVRASIVTETAQPILSDTRDVEDKENYARIESSHIQDQVRWDRSWHIVTHALVLPPFPKGNTSSVPLQPQISRLESTFYRALEDILDPATHIPYASHTEDIVTWHTQQVRSHFLNQVRPVITHIKKSSDQPDELVSESLEVLKTAHIQYLHGFGLIKDQLDSTTPDVSAVVCTKFQRDLCAVISNSVSDTLSEPLRRVVAAYVTMILGLPMTHAREKTEIQPESRSSERARIELLELVRSLKKVGLAGEKFQVTFAEIMHKTMKDYVQKGFKGIWSLETKENIPTQNFLDPEDSVLPRAAHLISPSQCTSDLCEWIENRQSKLAVQVLSVVDTPTTITWANKEKYKEMGIGHLADLRIRELFDIVINYPNSSGALDDLRTAITTPQRRLYLTEAFAKTLNERLLHPGTSTLQILQTYISMIWSFHSLDHSKVLLDRVAYPLQLYLCSRDDTVRIIIAGLLADPDDTHGKGGGADKLVELAQLLHNENQQVEYQSNNDGELDWHDMEWVPDPVDAGPGYKRSKNADIIGTLIGALGTSDIFIKEFQNIIGDHLLKNEGGFEREIKVLELLKTRFGEAPLQACEVMLKDIQDSGRVNHVIRRDQSLEPSREELEFARTSLPKIISPEGLHKPSFHAKILSRLFWPQLQDDSYNIPSSITDLQKHYEAGFETLKASRKLTWLPALGQATVQLEFEDRKIVEEVHTWQATIIYAFQSPDGSQVTHTIDSLTTLLEMDEHLVRTAVKFWVSKLVLHSPSQGTYTPLETLNKSEQAALSTAQTSSAAQAQQISEEEMDEEGNGGSKETEEKMAMYWQFIQGMLKNSSSQMPLGQISMMLKMFVGEGFPYSNEELKELLQEKVQEGVLELAGGKYKLRK